MGFHRYEVEKVKILKVLNLQGICCGLKIQIQCFRFGRILKKFYIQRTQSSDSGQKVVGSSPLTYTILECRLLPTYCYVLEKSKEPKVTRLNTPKKGISI